MSRYPGYLGKQSKTPGVYDNRPAPVDIPGRKLRLPYVVVAHNGAHSGFVTQAEAREAWKAEKERARAAPPPRRPVVSLTNKVTAAKRDHHRSRSAKPRGREKRKKPLNPDTARLPAQEFAAVQAHRGRTKGSCRDTKHVCSRCGWIIRTACRRNPPGTIKHHTRWDAESNKYVRCGGTFIVSE